MSQIFYVREKLLELLFLLCENINFLKTLILQALFIVKILKSVT